MTVLPIGTVPNFADPALYDIPEAADEPDASWGDQLDLNFENERWSKGAQCISPTFAPFPTATNPVTWTIVTSNILFSDSDGYYDPAFNDRLVVPSGRAGIYIAICHVVIGDSSTVTNSLTLDSYTLRAMVNSGISPTGYFVKLGSFNQCYGAFPAGSGAALLKLADGDLVQFQITSSTSGYGDGTKVMQEAKFEIRHVGVLP